MSIIANAEAVSEAASEEYGTTKVKRGNGNVF
jgi:hypothetical protein